MSLDNLETVQYTKEGRVARVVLNRPTVLNAMNLKMHQELAGIWDDIEQDDDIWITVLASAGERAFSVGQDLKELVKRTESGEPTSSFGSYGRPGWPRITERFEHRKPIIACVQGYALGGGFELALACDVIIASHDAIFGLTEAKLGLIAGAGGAFRLAQQLPQKIAMGYLMTGRKFDAQRAFELGLVNEVVAPNLLDQTVEDWVQDILSSAPLSVRAIKQVVQASQTMPIDEAFNTKFSQETTRQQSLDCQEGPLAFVEKRPPVWQGK